MAGFAAIGYVQDLKSVSPDHHIEQLSFVMPDKKLMHAEFDLVRVKP